MENLRHILNIYVLLSAVFHHHYVKTVLTVFVKIIHTLDEKVNVAAAVISSCLSWPAGLRSWASWNSMMMMNTTEDCHNHYLLDGSGWKSPHLAWFGFCANLYGEMLFAGLINSDGGGDERNHLELFLFQSWSLEPLYFLQIRALTVLWPSNLYGSNYSQTKVPSYWPINFKTVKFCCVKSLCCQHRPHL